MKDKIHPKYQAIKASCACGNEFETKSTTASKELKLEICSACHPFFTGKQKLIDSAGRVEKFNRKFGRNAAARSSTKKTSKKDKAE